MQLQNIHSSGRDIYLFLRDDEGKLTIKKESNFFPYFYEPCSEGDCMGYEGTLLKKVFVTKPSDIKKLKSSYAFESDISFYRRYMIDKVKEITPSKIRRYFVDMENQIPIGKSIPKPRVQQKADYPISCITLHDNLENKYHQWYLGDYKNESDLWFEFTSFIKNNPPDLLIAHNMDQYDYPYWHYRIPNFAENISPIGQYRFKQDGVNLPAGISIIDSIGWWKAITLNKEESYGQDALMEKYLGKGKVYSDIDFSVLSEDIKARNMEDVKGMVELEEKMQMIPHFDMIRRVSCVLWEDYFANSRVIDSLLLREAKEQGLVLPDKPTKESYTEEIKFEGGFREAFKTGRFYNVGKYDLSGAYCYAIIDLCLDSVNIKESQGENTIRVDVADRITMEKTDNYHIEQNNKALLPIVVKKLVTEKNKLKKIMSETDPSSPEYKDIERRYNAFKTIVLSAWGVIGNIYFRRYDHRVASMITSVVRDLLHYVLDRMKKAGHEIVYIDTDSAFCLDDGENLSELLNSIIEEWAILRFNKNVSITFDHEGHFEEIFIISKCNYKGKLNTGHGIKEENKGVIIKGKNHSKFAKKFMKTAIDKLLGKIEKEDMFSWIEEQIEIMKKEPLEQISFLSRLSKAISEYGSDTKTLQALRNTDAITKDIGQNFWFIYVTPEYYTEEKQVREYYREVPGKRVGKTRKEKLKVSEINKLGEKKLEEALERGSIKINDRVQKIKKAKDVMAFDKTKKDHLKPIDWDTMIEKNIYNKVEILFEALGWQEDFKSFKEKRIR